MRMPVLLRLTAFALTLAVTPLIAGCGSNPFDPEKDKSGKGTLPANTPPNDSPQNLLARFEATYEYQVIDDYAALLTADFRFIFSSQSDPTLVTQYGQNWGKVDERTSTENLFRGFTDGNGDYKAAASRIDFQFTGVNYFPDDLHPDSTEYYQVIDLPVVTGTIEIPDPSASDGVQVYSLNTKQKFHIVRGDAAVLDLGQDASASRWYIYKWEDLSPAIAAAVTRIAAANSQVAGTNGSSFVPVTFGAMKANYR